ncbi:MAG TPA: glycosyltransferase, partial [Candidatus Limnocylindrales bacterium]|nr:glycosyltransferase [Candidatus Limnocylindrales bacterium]
MSVASSRPIDVLVVGWYPAADAIAAGRFVADQVEALAATGRVRPCVVSFENVPVRGRRGAAQAAAVDANVAASVAVSSPFVEGGAAGAPHVPVARLAAPARERGAAPPDHRGRDRTRSLLALGLAEAADQPRWSLVHGHVGYPDGIAAAELAERLAVPYVITEHASFLATLLADPLVRERYRAALRGAARVIAVSRTLAEEVTAIVPELDGRIEVIPNAVAVDDFGHAGAARTGAGGGGGTDEPVDGPRVAGELLFVGARRASKGIETLLRAFAAVRAERPDAALRLIGDPGTGSDDDAAWRRLAAELGVGSDVRFEGPTDRSGVAAAMARADLFVHPSPRETFGVVAVEALAAGLPVVAADSGGVTEVLGDTPERLGGLAPRDDAPALAAAILTALGRRDAYDPAVLHAYAAERYAASVVADRLADVYRAVLSERPAAPVQPVPEGARAATERVDGSQAIDLVAARPIVVSWSALQLGAAARFPEAT